MRLADFLSSDAYTPVNKALARQLWFVCAWFLWELIRQRERFGGGEFYYSQADIEKEIWISAKVQRNCISILVKAWYLIVNKKGIPCKNWYIINDSTIMNCYELDLDKIGGVTTWCAQREQLDVTKGNDYYNKKDIKNTSSKEEAPTVQDLNFWTLWNAIATKKWWDEDKGLKEYQKKITSGCCAEDMIKLATLDKLEIREKICDVMYTQRKENWIRDFCSQSDEIMEARIVAILRGRYIRYLKWTKFKSNSVQELSDIFGKEYIQNLWIQVQREYKEQHW